MKKSAEGRELTDGDRQEFHALYLKYHHTVYSICLRMTKNVSDSEDLTQDVFIHLFRTIGSFRGKSAFTTWLHRLTVNKVLMHFRRRKVRPELSSDGEESLTYVAEHAHNPKPMRIVDRILLSEVIAKLPEGYQQAVILHDVEGWDHTEIAESTGRSIGTSKSQLHKGRMRLRELIAGHRQVNRRSVVSPV